MKKYIFKGIDGRIIKIQDCLLFPDENLREKEFDFPENFNFGNVEDYKIINGELIYDPLPIPETLPTEAERLDAIEALLLDMILEGKIEWLNF